MKEQRHFRTFCLAFHHFDEQGARGILEDAMRTADGIGSVLIHSRLERITADLRMKHF